MISLRFDIITSDEVKENRYSQSPCEGSEGGMQGKDKLLRFILCVLTKICIVAVADKKQQQL